MACHALEGVVALVSCRADGYLDPTPSIHAKLRGMGARVAGRLSKDVTHIIFNRRLNPTAQERSQEDADLRMLYDKASKIELPVAVVTPLWVSRSQELGRRALEMHFIVSRPAQPTATEQAIGTATASFATPGSSGGRNRSAAKRPTPRRFKALLKTEDLDLGLDLDSPVFSSSQQLKEEDTPWEHPPKAAGAGKKQRRRAAPRKSSPGIAPLRERLCAFSRAQQQLQTASKVVEAIATTKPATVPSSQLPLLNAETIPPTPGCLEPPAEPTTSVCPFSGFTNAERLSAAPSTPTVIPAVNETPSQRARLPPTPLCGDGFRTPAPPGMVSRVASAAATTPSRLAQDVDAVTRCNSRSPIDISLLSPAPSTADISTPKLANPSRSGVPFFAFARPKLKGPDPREGNTDDVDTPLKLLPTVKSNPLFQPDSTMRTYTNHAFSESEIPSPSPAGQRPVRCAQQGQLPRGASAGTPPAAHSVKVLQPKQENEYAASTGVNVRTSKGAAKRTPTLSGSLPFEGVSKRARTTSSVVGPLDGFLARPTAAPRTLGGFAVGIGGGSSMSNKSRVQAPKLKAPLPCRPASSTPAALGGSCRQSNSSGASCALLAATSVSPAEAELLKSTVRKLRGGFRLCPAGKQATHLIVGAERRTLKILQAIAAGTWLISPEWLRQSLRAGRWLPVEEHLAKVQFSEGAARARSCLTELGGSRLLEGYRIFVCDQSGEGKRARNNAEVLRDLAASLGAEVVPALGCTLCVITGGTGRPAIVPPEVPVVGEEWLFSSTERYLVEDMSSWLVK